MEIVRLCSECADNFDLAMMKAAAGGHLDIVRFCREEGATALNETMLCAAENGHVEIVKWCKQQGADVEWTYKRATSDETLWLLQEYRTPQQLVPRD